MRGIWHDILVALLMGFLLPGLLLSFAVMLLEERSEQPEETFMEETWPETVEMPMLLRMEDGTLSELDMDAYLVGVVLAEMPASFEEEALRAQSVVARTYTRKAYLTGGKHSDGSVCSQPSCCQAYISEAEYRERGGSEESIQKVRSAVYGTSGYVLKYEEELIEATYFSCSGGMTEDAVAVWGTDYPYLRSVVSPGEEQAEPYTDTVAFTRQAFQDALDRQLPGSPDSWFGAVTYTSGGGVSTMQIGGESYKGTQLRSLLGLRSTAFTVSFAGEEILITTKGYGHRVGMSQYGADAMAASGSSFQEILAWYYPGTELSMEGDK